jgi:hypothetical protein
MESPDKKEEKVAIKVPELQRTNPESEHESHKVDAEHRITSKKNIDLTDEDEALDSGI